MSTNWILGSKFDEVYPHLSGVKALWETKWKFPCKLSVYPFHDGLYSDFEPIFQRLIADNVNDAYTDEYTNYFLPTARKLAEEAMAAQASDRAKAIQIYLRACCVLRISRFPSVDGGTSGFKRQIFDEQKMLYLRGAALWEEPMTEVVIPHTAAGEGDGKEIPLYLRLPKGIKKGGAAKKCPVVILITGLDGHRPDNTGRSHEFHSRSWATLIYEPPGTADSPASRRDPLSPDRQLTSILTWLSTQAHLDASRVALWGLSAGGYYAVRGAHTHHESLVGAIAQGAGTHHFLGREWLSKVNNHEYPFELGHAYVKKYGYADWEELVEKAQGDFSLVLAKGESGKGLLEGRSCRLLLVNGMADGLMPVEDSMLLCEYGRPKECRFYRGMLHMGYPPANECVWPWLEEVLGRA